MLANGVSNQDVVHYPLVLQGLACDRGGVMLCQPALEGRPLIGVPISGYHGIQHCALQECSMMTKALGQHASQEDLLVLQGQARGWRGAMSCDSSNEMLSSHMCHPSAALCPARVQNNDGVSSTCCSRACTAFN